MEIIAFHQSTLHLLVRVCMAEAESMATDLSRSPLYVCGGHLHAFEKLLVAKSTSTRRYYLSCGLCTQEVEQGRDWLLVIEGVGRDLPIGGKAS